MVTIVDFLAQAIKNKPTDGTDCQTLEAAQKELGKLRRVTGKVVKVLSTAKDLASQQVNGNGAVAPLPPDLESGRSKSEGRKKMKKKRNAMTVDQSFKVYKKITVDKSSEERTLIKSAIKFNPLFTDFADSDMEDFIDVFSPKSVSGGFTVIKQGDMGNTFYVVQSGALDIFLNMGDEGTEMKETQVGVPYVRGGAFGELALMYESTRAATIRASEDCELWVLTRTAFKGLQLQIERKAHDLKLSQLKTVKIGKKMMGDIMNPEQLDAMAMATQYQKFDADSVIVKEGEKGNTFYIITKGEVDIYKKSAGSGKIATLGVSSFFGEKALLGSDTRQASCVAVKNTECLTLARDDFVLMLGNFQDILEGRKTVPSEIMTASLFIKRGSSTMTLRDLKVKRVLGVGAFGKVNLVKSKTDGKLYAIKAQGKANVVEHDFKEKLLTEYRMMQELNHPFIVQCFQSFQDKKYIYFLMRLLPGGELLDLLDNYDKLPESWARFYCAAVVSVFEHMHTQKIAYRDLKPENLVLDEKGYCHVIDLGLAKCCDTGKTWTTCGTPAYLAPEIITGKGHDWGVDYWALGVLLYELVDGYSPFYDENPTNTAKKVIKGTYNIPPTFSRKLVDLISRLLRVQSKRLGRIQGGVRMVRKHVWFADFQWQELLDCKLEVPWVPKLGNLEKLGEKDDGKWDAPDCDWEPNLDEEYSA